ncbi:MAG TPA: pyrroline-5-carboxylate reductase [Sphingomonas sp.]
MTPDSILLVGCGNMGRAMLNGWLAAGIDPARIAVIDPSSPDLPDGVLLLADAPAAAPECLVIAVKPQKLAEVGQILGRAHGPETIVLSVLAAVEFAPLRRHVPDAKAIARAVPNLPAAIGQGITALVLDRDCAPARAMLERLCAPLGPVEWLAGEALCDPVTAVSGCGPAFLFRFADATIRAGVGVGLDREQARRLVIQTLLGSARLLAASDEEPATLAARVASPGGVTLAGLAILDRDEALATLLDTTLQAANQRSLEMARLYR